MSSSPTVQAVCPGCQHPLRIPREHLGKSVKCKKCGTVVRTKAKPDGDSARHQPVGAAAAVPPAYPNGAVPYSPPPAAPPAAAQGHPYAPPPGYAYPAPVAANPLEV